MRIYDGRPCFYQWDINQQLTADGLAVGDEVHFANAAQASALVVKAYALEDGTVVADVPNILLQAALPLAAYRYIKQGEAESTREDTTFTVQKRPRPSDYIYTETEVHSFELLAEEMRQALATLEAFNATQDETLRALGEADAALRAELAGKVDIPKNPGSNKVLVSRWNNAVELWGMQSIPTAGEIAMFSERKTLRTSTATDPSDAVPLAQMQEHLAEKADTATFDTLAKKVENLEAGVAPDMFTTDSTTAHVKPIPADAAPYAELRAVGGMIHTHQLPPPNLFSAAALATEVDKPQYSETDNTTAVLKQGSNGSFYVTQENYTHGNVEYTTEKTVAELFPGVKVGKKYTFSYTDGGAGESITFDAAVSAGVPFTMTEAIYNGHIHFAGGWTQGEDDPMAWPCDGNFSNITLTEVGGGERYLTEAKVTALDIYGKNLYNGGFEGSPCSYIENGSLVLAKERGERFTNKWYPPVPIKEAYVTFTAAVTNLTSTINAEIVLDNGTITYAFSTSVPVADKVATIKFPAHSSGGNIKSIALYIHNSEAEGVFIHMADIAIFPTATPADTAFTSYRAPHTFAIPEAVQALDGYGWAVTDSRGDLHNTIEWDENGKPTFIKRVGKYVYNGTEQWDRKPYDEHIEFSHTPPKKKPDCLVICNKYKRGYVKWGDFPCMNTTPSPLVFYPDNPPDTVEGWKALLAQWATEGDPLTVYYELAEPIVTDVSAYFTEDNLIPVEGGGVVVTNNENEEAAPSTIVYQKRGA